MFIDLHLKLLNKTVSMLSSLCVIGGKKALKVRIHLGTKGRTCYLKQLRGVRALGRVNMGTGVIKRGGGLPVELRRPGMNESQWRANTGDSHGDLDISLGRIPATVKI